jgi:hypothetical protein
MELVSVQLPEPGRLMPTLPDMLLDLEALPALESLRATYHD